MDLARIFSRLSKRRYKSKKHQMLTYLGAGLLVVGLLVFQHYYGGDRETTGLPSGRFNAKCVKVIDGDTIYISYQKEEVKIRVLGIDTMDSHNKEKKAQQARTLGTSEQHIQRMSRWAKDKVTEMVLNKEVTLVYSGSEPERDPYNRLLCYVEVGDRDIGAILLKAGLAESRREPHARSVQYKKLNEEARSKGRGIYGVPKI